MDTEPASPPEGPPLATVHSRRRWFVVLAPVLVTVVLGLVVGGFLVVQNVDRAERIEEADDVASDYLSQVATFREGIATALGEAKEDPASLRKALKAAAADPPALGIADQVGMDESTTYAEALEVQASLLTPYEALAKDLKQADEGLTYVAAARKVLSLRASDYVDGYLLSTSDQVRNALIPAYVRARDELAQVPVPDGQEKLAATVRGAVQTAIDRATALASSIDANQRYTFTYGDVYQAAATAVDDYATQVQGDLTEALNTVTDLQRQ